MRRRLVVVAVAMAAFAADAAPSHASCLDALTWQGQMYTGGTEVTARPGAALSARARVPGPSDCGPVIIHIGGLNPRPLEPEVMQWDVVHSLVGVPPTVAVLRDGRVYRNTAPLKAPLSPGWFVTA